MKNGKPLAGSNDLSNLAVGPLAPLTALAQWCGWCWLQGTDGEWQPRPVMASAPDRPASADDPATWCDYGSALAAVQARVVDGIAFVLTPADPFAVMNLNNCRHPRTRSIDMWAQNFLDVTCESYAEATSLGGGIRIWGLSANNTVPVRAKFALEIDGKPVVVELSRRSRVILPITGVRLDTVAALANIDHGIDWAITWGERRKAQAAEAALPIKPAPAPAPTPKPQPKPAAEVSEKPAPGPAPKPAPSAPAPPGPAAAPAASRNGVHHAARARSSILFDLSEVTTIDLADLINDPVPKQPQDLLPVPRREQRRACTSTQITTTASAATPTATTSIG